MATTPQTIKGPASKHTGYRATDSTRAVPLAVKLKLQGPGLEPMTSPQGK